MLPFQLTFSTPWVLLTLPLLLFLPRVNTWGLRALALALLIVSLAGPLIGRPSHDVAVLVDVSDSVGGNALEATRAFDFSGLPEAPAVFYFAGDATRVRNLASQVPDFLDTSSTDLARALQVAASSGAKRVLLVSDGVQSLGDVRLALPRIPVDTLAVAGRDNVRLTGLMAPDQATPGETVEVVAVIETDRRSQVTLYPTAASKELAPIRLTLEPGQTSVPFTFPVGEKGTVRVTANLQPDFEQPRVDDSLAIDVAISNREPFLVLNDPALAQLLRTQDFEVVEGSEVDIRTPLAYSAIAIREGAGRFTPGQLQLLHDYVENGGGLMMTGGPSSFGLGAWYRTPVEEVLPVNTDLRTEVQLPLVALIIVMDRSQSMSTGNPSKIDLAKEGAISVVDLAYQDDLLGLIVFSDANATDWVFPLRPATDRGKREMLNAILNINTQGGTVLKPAYELALTTLAQTNASVKHIIILSDGKLYDGQGPFSNGSSVDFNAMALQGLAARITTSTIAIGDSADFQRLESIARAGGGRYYQALDVNTLPQIFTSEALTATRSLLREERLTPIPHQHPLAAFSSAVPPLDAYIASSLKADAEILLEGLQGEPILAVRRQGLGRTAALTTDLNSWAGPFGNWSELPALLGTVTRWLQARPADFSAAASQEGNRLRVVVDAVKNGAYVNNRTLVARYDGSSITLAQVAPGRYEGYFEAAGSGGTLVVADGDEVVARSRVSTPNPEFDRVGSSALLADIAAGTGGELLTSSGSYAPPTPSSATPIWPWFALSGLLVFLVELLVRRFAPNSPRPRRATTG